MEDKIAILGSKDMVMLFKAVGCDVFSPVGKDKIRASFSKLISNYKIILIQTNYAKLCEDLIEQTKTTAYPIVLVVPNKNEENTYALDKIVTDMERSIGAKIVLEEEKHEGENC
jgi:V/A-type H+/Na+-transporting ATPase subunit F